MEILHIRKQRYNNFAIHPYIYVYDRNREWKYSRKTIDQEKREKSWRHRAVAERAEKIWKKSIWEKEKISMKW